MTLCCAYTSAIAIGRIGRTPVATIESMNMSMNVCIGIKTLCSELCDSTEQCLQYVDNDELAKHEVRVVDVVGIVGFNRPE